MLPFFFFFVHFPLFSSFPQPSRKRGNQRETHYLVCTEGEVITAFLYAITTLTTPRYPQTTRNKDIGKCFFLPTHHKMWFSSSQIYRQVKVGAEVCHLPSYCSDCKRTQARDSLLTLVCAALSNFRYSLK